jgi:hypothetical protein
VLHIGPLEKTSGHCSEWPIAFFVLLLRDEYAKVASYKKHRKGSMANVVTAGQKAMVKDMPFELGSRYSYMLMIVPSS